MEEDVITPTKPGTAIARDPIRQYSLFLENRVGALADVVKLLHDSGIDVLGLSLQDSVDMTVARMVVSDPETTHRIFNQNSIAYCVVDLVVVELKEGAAELNRCLNALLIAETNIHFVYPLLTRPNGHALLALCIDDAEFGASALTRSGFKVLTQADLSRWQSDAGTLPAIPQSKIRNRPLNARKNIAVVGTSGRLGAAIARVLEATPDFTVTPYPRHALDLTDPDQIRSQLAETEFDILINAAAYTAVDDCEKFPEQAHAINSDAVRTMAEICADRKVRMVHISTDFVFDGQTDTPYTETDTPNPLSVYGRSKFAGEQFLLDTSSDNLAVRVSWIFGPDRPGFPDWLIQNALVKENFTVVRDKIGSPTFSSDCARNLIPLLFGQNAIGGIIHLCNTGAPAWIEWGQYCLDRVAESGIELKTKKLGGILMESLPNFIAQRPHYSALSTEKFAALTGAPPRPWQDAITDYITRYLVPNLS